MEMPPIHMCAFLNHENERLKTKIADLKRHIAHLEKVIVERNLDHIHSCSISCQTDIDIQRRPSPTPIKTTSDEQIRLHRLLKAQNELLKEYENESLHHRCDLSSTSVIDDYERRLRQCEVEKEEAMKRAQNAEKRAEAFSQRYERMKKELSALDGNFFDEIEDLKYALQQANNLNREYEKTVQMLSNRLGISYPATTAKSKRTA